VELTLWDTGGGGEDYIQLLPMSYPETDFFLLCYAVDNRDAFCSVEDEWYPHVVQHYPKALRFLVGTKVDLRTQEVDEHLKSNIVSYEEGLDLAKKLRLTGYMECSSLTGDGVR
ncbi:unnamed protein product, partial [Meganyctiphanes norvegica]